jgi:hypothetical protein
MGRAEAGIRQRYILSMCLGGLAAFGAPPVGAAGAPPPTPSFAAESLRIEHPELLNLATLSEWLETARVESAESTDPIAHVQDFFQGEFEQIAPERPGVFCSATRDLKLRWHARLGNFNANLGPSGHTVLRLELESSRLEADLAQRDGFFCWMSRWGGALQAGRVRAEVELLPEASGSGPDLDVRALELEGFDLGDLLFGGDATHPAWRLPVPPAVDAWLGDRLNDGLRQLLRGELKRSLNRFLSRRLSEELDRRRQPLGRPTEI